MSREGEAKQPRRGLPERSVRPNDLRWPSPVPLPFYPPDEVAKTLHLILVRLDNIEKRLENIEKTLLQR